MKNLKRLAVAADFLNHPHGYLVLRLVDSDGGQFELHPCTDGQSIFLPSNDAPAYRVAITAEDPDALKRLGNALLALHRSQTGGDPDTDE